MELGNGSGWIEDGKEGGKWKGGWMERGVFREILRHGWMGE